MIMMMMTNNKRLEVLGRSNKCGKQKRERKCEIKAKYKQAMKYVMNENKTFKTANTR